MFSQQDGASSSEFSSSILKIFENILQIDFSNFIFDMNVVIRKFAHFGEYVVLGFLVSLTIKDYQKSKFKIIMYSLIFCIFIALTDEFHQTFIIMRNGNIIDAFIDTLGSMEGIFFSNLKEEKRHING